MIKQRKIVRKTQFKMSCILRGMFLAVYIMMPMITAQNIPLWQDLDFNFQPLPLEGATYVAKRNFAGFGPDLGLTTYKREFPFEDFMVKRSADQQNPVQYR